MYYKAQEKFVRVKYNPKLDPGSLENVKNILDANPLQGVMERIYDLEEECSRAEETFIRNSLVEVGVDPDALIRTAKLNAHLQTVLKNTLAELEEVKKKAAEVVKRREWISVDERLPEVETTVLVLATRKYKTKEGLAIPVITRAMYEDGTVPRDDSCWFWEDIDFIYDEENDIAYIPEGWWEDLAYGDECGAIDYSVTHWMPLPEPPKGD